jgi:hypothetical protein
MSNKPNITSSFLNYNRYFADNQRITDTDICIFVCIFVHTCVHSFRRYYTRFGVYPNHIHITIIVKNNLLKKKKNTTAQIGTNVRARGFNAGLLARSQFASGRSCDRPSRSRLSVVFLGPRTNAELLPKFHIAHAALQMVTLKISP